jgi:ABC-type Fe3+ transport system substrate-binding protein
VTNLPCTHRRRNRPSNNEGEKGDLNKWSVFAGFGMCMAYNKDRIHTPPKNGSDLIDAKWKGRIGLEDIDTAGSQYGQYYMLRNELGASFCKKRYYLLKSLKFTTGQRNSPMRF